MQLFPHTIRSFYEISFLYKCIDIEWRTFDEKNFYILFVGYKLVVFYDHKLFIYICKIQDDVYQLLLNFIIVKTDKSSFEADGDRYPLPGGQDETPLGYTQKKDVEAMRPLLNVLTGLTAAKREYLFEIRLKHSYKYFYLSFVFHIIFVSQCIGRRNARICLCIIIRI